MAINKAMKLALKALSYPDVDIKKMYKLQRSFEIVKSPLLLGPLIYKNWDHKVISGGREITVRIYTPQEKKSKKILLFFHGGGWVTESIDTYNSICMNLADNTHCKVVSVEYRLAPENPFPCGLDDCYAVAKELYLNAACFSASPDDIVLIGDSAGGNLAAAVSLRARDEGAFSVTRQILIYPATYHDHTESSPFPSVLENGKDYLLTSKRICDYMELYQSCPEDLHNPYFAPLLAKSFENQPDTLVITAEFDPLRDEGEAYAQRLKEAGADVTLYRMEDALHGFFSLDPRYAAVQKAYSLINDFLNGDEEPCQPDREHNGAG